MKTRNINKLVGLMMVSSVMVACSGNIDKVTPEVLPIEKPTEVTPTLETRQQVEITYSNLTTPEIQDELFEKLINNQVSEDRIETLSKWVDDYNLLIAEYLKDTQAMMTKKISDIYYKDIYFEPRLTEDNIPYSEINCRLTTFLVMQDSINFEEVIDTSDAYLMFDLDAITNHPLIDFDQQAQEKFVALFNPLAVEEGMTLQEHEEAILDEWVKRGVTFNNEIEMALMNVWLHDEYEQKRFVGHSAIAMYEEGYIYLFEKYAPLAPYQYTVFSSEEEVYNYLLSRSDIYGGEEALAPILTKNNTVFKF